MTDTEFSNAVSPDMAALFEVLAAETGPPVDTTLMPPAEGRAYTSEFNKRWNRTLPEMARAGDVAIAANAELGTPPLRAKVLVPPDARPGAILFAHGGGFVFCTPETHERFARLLARESGLAVVSPDYRLAPEHPFPAPVHDVVAALRAIVAGEASLGLQPGPVLVGGDSAGANLVLAAMLHEQAAGRRAGEGALLFYGVYGADLDTRSYLHFAEGPGLTRGRMLRFWDHYAPARDARKNPLAAPILASDAALRALPPLHLTAAGIDPLLSDSLALAARLAKLGRTEKLVVTPGVVHGYLQMSEFLPAALADVLAAGAAARAMAEAARARG